MNSVNVENLIESIKTELKLKFNKEANNYGCEIDDVDVKFVDYETVEKNYEGDTISAVLNKGRAITDYKLHKSNNTSIISIIGILIVLVFSGILIDKLYVQTNNLIFYFCSLLYMVIPRFMFFSVISYIICILLIKSNSKNIRKWLCCFIFTILFTCIFEAFVVSSNFGPKELRYNYIKVEENKISLLNFRYNVVKDIINKQTQITVVNKQDITAISTIRSSRTPSKHYINYKILKDNNQIYTYSAEYSASLVYIINELKKFEDEITIEYYTNSGVIKSIDGIEIFEYEQFAKRLANLKIQKIEQISNEKKEKEEQQKQKQEELNNKNQIEFEIKQNAVGMNIEDLKKELNEKNVQDYSVKYISSKLGSVNSVIFVDNINFCFYVIRDNNYEEMTEMPNIKLGMSKVEVMKLLEEKGLNYNFYEATATSDKNKIDTLCSYTYSPGTLVPKGVEVGIGLYVYYK